MIVLASSFAAIFLLQSLHLDIVVVAGVIVAEALWILALYRQSSEREELFRIIAENAADMIALVNVKGRRLYNSPAYERVLGYSAAETRGDLCL